MRSADDIEGKLKQLKKERLSRFLAEHTRPKPENCRHNSYALDDVEEGGLCMLTDPEEWHGKICDSVDTASNCPFFDGRHDEEELRAEFEAMLEDDEVVNRRFRDISALRWVLQGNYDEDLSWFEWFSVKYLGGDS